MLKIKKSNSPEQRSSSAMKRARKNIYAQALLAALMVFLTVVVMFAITAAWYTNVVQTGGLVFEAEAWGFEGTVELDTSAVIKAAPGEEGVISLTAVNDGDSITAVSVNINKSQMPHEIQQRIYFYVDVQSARNGEIVDGVYLSNLSSYTYTMLGKGTLNLGETVHNDAQIKWHWVYDVLGYYVLGTLDEESGEFRAEEYLRPIEYDYDEATTTFEIDADGNLTGNVTSINGVTPDEFLEEISSNDGYPGVIDTDNVNYGYYEVDVDENGYGVWAYLCTYSEIEENTVYDTELGTQEEKEQYTAVITLSAQNSDVEATVVGTPAGLMEVLETAELSGTPAVVKLSGNLTMAEAICLENMGQAMIDLSGYTLELSAGTYASKEAGIQLDPGSALTVINGTLKGADDKGIAAYVSGAELMMSDVTVTDAECAVYIRDDKNTANADSKIRLVGCTFDTPEEGIYISGNGSDSGRKTQLIVENCNISSGYAGIMGNGSGNQSGTDVQIISSTVTGRYAGVYHPQKNSYLTVSGSVISGNTGLVLKGGHADIIGSTVSGTGESNPPTEMPVSGFTDTGDGIYIETNYGYEITLRLRDESQINSLEGEPLRIYEEDAENVSVSVISAYLGDVYVSSEAAEENEAAEIDIIYEEEDTPDTIITEESFEISVPVETTAETTAETTTETATETTVETTTDTDIG